GLVGRGVLELAREMTGLDSRLLSIPAVETRQGKVMDRDDARVEEEGIVKVFMVRRVTHLVKDLTILSQGRMALEQAVVVTADFRRVQADLRDVSGVVIQIDG